MDSLYRGPASRRAARTLRQFDDEGVTGPRARQRCSRDPRQDMASRQGAKLAKKRPETDPTFFLRLCDTILPAAGFTRSGTEARRFRPPDSTAKCNRVNRPRPPIRPALAWIWFLAIVLERACSRTNLAATPVREQARSNGRGGQRSPCELGPAREPDPHCGASRASSRSTFLSLRALRLRERPLTRLRQLPPVDTSASRVAWRRGPRRGGAVAGCAGRRGACPGRCVPPRGSA